MTQALNPFNDYVFLNATPAERGSFSLALDKALEKLQKFQLPDPSHFVLQWIQALVAAESTQIQVRFEDQGLLGDAHLEIRFDGPGYTSKELLNLYDHVFLSGRDRGVDRLRELALGWLSASSLKPSRLSVASNGEQRLHDQSQNAQNGSGKASIGSVQQVDFKSHLLSVSFRCRNEMEELIRLRCVDVPIPLFLNGEQISNPTNPCGVPWPNRAFESGPSKGVMGATYGHDATTQISFLRYGVNFVSRPEPALQPPVIFRVNDPTLSKNVSQTDVVRDEAYDEFLSRLRVEMKAMGMGLTRMRIPSYQRDSLNRFIQAYIVNHLDIRALSDPDRVALLGPDYEGLLNYPVFCSTLGHFRSLAELYEVYRREDCLLYCLASEARTVKWQGILLVLEVEEVKVLKKFFPHLIGLSIEEVRRQARLGGTASHELHQLPPKLAETRIQVGTRSYSVIALDAYPAGQITIKPERSKFGTALPNVGLSWMVEFRPGPPPDQSEIVRLQMTLSQAIPSLRNDLRELILEAAPNGVFSRLRAAELVCEMLLYEIESKSEGANSQELVDGYLDIPIISLENGRLVSLSDLRAYLRHLPHIYLGGAFLDGMESGAIDPMPEAAKLIRRLFPSDLVIPTERVRKQLLDGDAELRFELRRQTIISGMGSHPNPSKAIEMFATEAAAVTAEIQRMEAEYRKALAGPVLFCKPDQERLEQLVIEDEDQTILFDLNSAKPPTVKSDNPDEAYLGKVPLQERHEPGKLPSLEVDIDRCRQRDPEFLHALETIHVERCETDFSFHLATSAQEHGRLYLFQDDNISTLEHRLPIEGCVRIASQGSLSSEETIREATEQLVNKAIHALRDGPPTGPSRMKLRRWLLSVCCRDPARLQRARSNRHDLYDLPLVPCLGGSYLSWRSLLEQAERDQETLVATKGIRPCPSREVILLDSPLTKDVLSGLGFPTPRTYLEGEDGDQGFEHLYRSTRRILTSVLGGHDTPLLHPGLIEKLSEDASLWTRWRSGFLSWDRDQSVAIINPSHKIGTKLLKRYDADSSWSKIFALALFSTINRGLEEVEDRHELAFLEALVDTLE